MDDESRMQGSGPSAQRAVEQDARMRKVILVDIDHTLSSAHWRDGMICGPQTDWDAYHSASVDDEPVADIVRMIQLLALMDMTIVGVTTRPEKFRRITMDWLIRHGVPMMELLMRPADDYRPAPIIKVEQVRDRFSAPENEVAFILDDRDDVIAAFCGLGITALQVYARRS